MEGDHEILEVLKQIRRNQEIILEGQQQALALQREQFELAKTQEPKATRRPRLGKSSEARLLPTFPG